MFETICYWIGFCYLISIGVSLCLVGIGLIFDRIFYDTYLDGSKLYHWSNKEVLYLGPLVLFGFIPGIIVSCLYLGIVVKNAVQTLKEKIKN